MGKFQKILLYAYLFIISILGIFFVPCYTAWGNPDEKNVFGLEIVPVWKLTDKTIQMNGMPIRYELCVSRIIYQFLLITLIMCIAYLIIYAASKKRISQ